jgi:hypothetical protein
MTSMWSQSAPKPIILWASVARFAKSLLSMLGQMTAGGGAAAVDDDDDIRTTRG